jgi:hypothetical protein
MSIRKAIVKPQNDLAMTSPRADSAARQILTSVKRGASDGLQYVRQAEGMAEPRSGVHA